MRPSQENRFQKRFKEGVEAAQKAGITQEQLRAKIGCSKNMIQHWKAGKYRPQHHHAEAISRVLNIPIEELFEGEEGRPSGEGMLVPKSRTGSSDLLGRLAGLQLEASLRKLQGVRPDLQHLDGILPDLLDLLDETRRHVQDGD